MNLGPPNPRLITQALDINGLYGPEVDAALGVNEPAVDEWETGARIPSAEQIVRLAALTGFDPAFFYGDDPPDIGPIFMCKIGRRATPRRNSMTDQAVKLQAAGTPHQRLPGEKLGPHGGYWLTDAFYSAAAPPPKEPGAKAMQVWHTSDSGLRADLIVFAEREDIGEVVVTWQPGRPKGQSDYERLRDSRRRDKARR